MSTAVSPGTQYQVWLPLLARIAARLSQGEHSLRFVDAAFDELAGALALDAYLYYQAEGEQLVLLAYRGIDELQAERHDVLAANGGSPESPALPDLSAELDLSAGVHLPLVASGRRLGSF